jgi:hypothetical protein
VPSKHSISSSPHPVTLALHACAAVVPAQLPSGQNGAAPPVELSGHFVAASPNMMHSKCVEAHEPSAQRMGAWNGQPVDWSLHSSANPTHSPSAHRYGKCVGHCMFAQL